MVPAIVCILLFLPALIDAAPSKRSVCTVGGVAYKPGQSFKAPDGCNTCTCMADGNAACTEMACLLGNGCEYNGQHYANGQAFKSSDGCNSCGCNEGTVICTKRFCFPSECTYIGQKYHNGASFPSSDGCNTCTCTMFAVACTQMACSDLERR